MELDIVHQMDCIRGMNERVDEGSVDVIVTSPPYNIGVKYNSHDDNLDAADYLKWMNEFGRSCRRVLKDDGSLFFNIGDKASDELKSFEVARQINQHLRLQNTIHWVKSISIDDMGLSIGHFKPVNSQRYLNNCHEYIFHFTKNKDVEIGKLAIGVPYADKSNIGRWKSAKQDRRDRGNTWYIPYETVQAGKEHPAAFPKKLPEMCIKLHGCSEETVVLDPFAGSGTTCQVAKELGCHYIGFEIDADYVRMANEKLRQQKVVSYI